MTTASTQTTVFIRNSIVQSLPDLAKLHSRARRLTPTQFHCQRSASDALSNTPMGRKLIVHTIRRRTCAKLSLRPHARPSRWEDRASIAEQENLRSIPGTFDRRTGMLSAFDWMGMTPRAFQSWLILTASVVACVACAAVAHVVQRIQ
jgi:hypothetical protein